MGSIPSKPSRLKLQPPEELNWLRCRAYYDVLNDIPEFQASLLELDDFVEPFCPLYPLTGDLSVHVWPKVDAFVRRWRLPTLPAQFPNGQRGARAYGFNDMLGRYSVKLPARHPGEIRRLTVAGRSAPRSVLDQMSEPYSHEDGRFDADVTPPTIYPKQPEAIAYDPTALSGTRGAMTPKELTSRIAAVAAAVKRDMQAQAAAIEEKARRMGWAAVGQRYHKDAEVVRGALRLYQRAVLEMSCQDIMEKESRENAGDASETAIRAAVKEWATLLGVELPKV